MVSLAGEEYLTRKEVQDILHVSKFTMIEWAKLGKPPTPYRMGGRVFYKKIDVDNLMQEVPNGPHTE